MKTLPRSAACLPASESRQAANWSLQGGDRGCGPLRSSGRRRLHHLLSSYSVRQTTNMRYMGSSALSLIMGVHIFPYQIVQRCGRNPCCRDQNGWGYFMGIMKINVPHKAAGSPCSTRTDWEQQPLYYSLPMFKKQLIFIFDV